MGLAQVLKEFYLELRRKAVGSVDSAPITTRQLESLVRLAEARARADLRQVQFFWHADLLNVSKFICKFG